MSENIYVLEESSSEYSTSSEDEEEEIIQNTEFMNNTNVTEYVSNRNNLFIIVVLSAIQTFQL